MSKLIDTVSNVSGASFVGIDTVTEPTLKGGKSNPHKGRVKKIMEGASVMVFQNKAANGYENMVKRRLESEGKSPDFELSPRKWGERLPNLPVVTHKGKEYLEVIFLKPGKVHYTLDGKFVSPSEIQGLNLEKSEAIQGGLSDDNKVIIRTFAADSITRMRIDGQTVNF